MDARSEYSFRLAVAGFVLAMTATGCGHTGEPTYSLEQAPDCDHPEAASAERIARAREGVRSWLEVDSVVSSTFPTSSDEEGLAVRSYPEGEGRLSRKSYLYDNALAVLWFSWTGRDRLASGVVRTLLARQRSDGSWFTQFDLEHPESSSETVRHGAVAWAGYALAHHAGRSGSKAAKRGAERAADHLWRARARVPKSEQWRGLIPGGGSVGREGMRTAGFAATEHNVDAHMLLARVAPERAGELRKQIIDRVWNDDSGRFMMGRNRQGPDRRRALDAAGAWGALWLSSIGQQARARRSLGYVLEHFRSTGVDAMGFRPYLDPIGSYQPERLANHIFAEGTFSVGLAASRLGRDAVTRKTLGLGVQLHCMTGGGIPYSNRQTPNFAATPAAAPSFWFLFVEREWWTGQPAPVFRRVHPRSQETFSTDVSQ